LLDIIVDGGESAKSLQRPGVERLLALVDGKKVDAVIVAKLDRLTRSVKDLCTLLDSFERRGVALVMRYVRSPASFFADSIFSPPLLPRMLTKPRTV
jgi:DNA invertase Pin-like site-specific DNA recombinase